MATVKDSNEFEEIWVIITSMAKAKLLMNRHKGDITTISGDDLIEMAKGELDELHEAIVNGTYMEVIEEAADVLNFTTAAVHKAVNAYRNRKNG